MMGVASPTRLGYIQIIPHYAHTILVLARYRIPPRWRAFDSGRLNMSDTLTFKRDRKCEIVVSASYGGSAHVGPVLGRGGAFEMLADWLQVTTPKVAGGPIEPGPDKFPVVEGVSGA